MEEPRSLENGRRPAGERDRRGTPPGLGGAGRTQTAAPREAPGRGHLRGCAVKRSVVRGLQGTTETPLRVPTCLQLTSASLGLGAPAPAPAPPPHHVLQTLAAPRKLRGPFNLVKMTLNRK